MSACQLLSLSVLLILGACSSAATASPDSARPTLDPPFTAAQIRLSNPSGTLRVYRVERDSEPPRLQVGKFLDSGVEHAVYEWAAQDIDGNALGEPQVQKATWSTLRDHAAFPAALTRRTETVCEVPAGRFDCWMYLVRNPTDGALETTRYYFAKDHPGPPVLIEQGADGQVRMRMALVSLEQHPPTPSR